eukprot:GHVR01013417.1.p1 GENE.GHVR01013417.1~~GHVR01013417.1.p1  ORF type:complete len:402 (-),score=62.48 GHVR01013417.1:182-1387(-)
MNGSNVSVLVKRNENWHALRVHPQAIIKLRAWCGVSYDADGNPLDASSYSSNVEINKETSVPYSIEEEDILVYPPDTAKEVLELVSGDVAQSHDVTFQGVLARGDRGAIFPARVLKLGHPSRQIQVAELQQDQNGVWGTHQLMKVRHSDVVQWFSLDRQSNDVPLDVLPYITGTSRSDPYEPSTVPISAAGGEVLIDPGVACGEIIIPNTVEAVESEAESIVAESVDVQQESITEAQVSLAIDNAAKGHMLVSKEQIASGSHNESRLKELDRWRELKVLDLIEQVPKNVLCVPCIWVDTWKLKDKQRIAKSRLVGQGFKDPRNPSLVETYSGTANAEMIRIAFVYAVTRGWKACKTDIRTAFLQAELDEEGLDFQMIFLKEQRIFNIIVEGLLELVKQSMA